MPKRWTVGRAGRPPAAACNRADCEAFRCADGLVSAAAEFTRAFSGNILGALSRKNAQAGYP